MNAHNADIIKQVVAATRVLLELVEQLTEDKYPDECLYCPQCGEVALIKVPEGHYTCLACQHNNYG